jgi:hypothetical protein
MIACIPIHDTIGGNAIEAYHAKFCFRRPEKEEVKDDETEKAYENEKKEQRSEITTFQVISFEDF